jgi:hypothetical protein
LILAHYSPRDPQGNVVQVPACWDTWGTETEAVKVGTAKKLHDLGIAADAYWMDAGWYPPIGDPGANGDWSAHRGNWTASKSLFPHGLKPVGEATPKEISGADFAHYQVSILDQPGSALIFYRKK